MLAFFMPRLTQTKLAIIYFMRKDIDVIAKMKKTEQVEPLEIIWEDGRHYPIDRILEIRRVASTKGGGTGIRYKVRIGQHIRFIFLDGFVWFIEVES